jgi:hypothetical protein
MALKGDDLDEDGGDISTLYAIIVFLAIVGTITYTVMRHTREKADLIALEQQLRKGNVQQRWRVYYPYVLCGVETKPPDSLTQTDKDCVDRAHKGLNDNPALLPPPPPNH